MNPRISVYIAASLDGFIARPDGDLDWLHAAAAEGEDYGYDEFLAGIDLVAMGRGTYDHIAGIDPVPYGGRPVEVFTSRPPAPREGVAFVAQPASDAVARWTVQGVRNVYVDGGELIRQFLAIGAVDDLVVTVVPLILGEGLALFPPSGVETPLRLTGTQSWPSGMVQLRYAVARPAAGS
ncbi:MAG: dihydrofolate reductase [Frankiales bacterium]|nr:dihydrofolate reductase [Frankiales bacterium]